MSLYTPVFPSLLQVNGVREGFPEENFVDGTGKKRDYVEFLRDVHLFLSTQNDVLSPPSRPPSPTFDHRVQKVKDEIQDILKGPREEWSSGKWTRVSQTLKLGCVRGRHWTVPNVDRRVPGDDVNWILPDEESEWIEWETQREESRRLKRTTNTTMPQHAVASVPPAAESQKKSAVVVEPKSWSQPCDASREWCPPRVSSTVVRAAKEKVRKWQASVPSEVWHTPSASQSSPASSMATAPATVLQSKTGAVERGRTIDFAVMKPVAKSMISKRGRGFLSQPVVGGSLNPVPFRKPRSPKPAKTSDVDVRKAGPGRTPGVSPAKDDIDIPKIRDVPETPYLPPSFPAHLETSTPLAGPAMVIRAKPPPISPFPVSCSTPPPSTPADPPDHRQLIMGEAQAGDMPSTSHRPQADAGKRPQALSTSLDGVVDDVLTAPVAKRLRTLTQDTPISQPIIDVLSPEAAPSQQHSAHSHEFAVPLPPGTGDEPVVPDLDEKLASPPKSVKSYFSAADSDPAESPMRVNLLLESPVSPMLSYAQNPSGFLPQVTSTQTRKGSPVPAGGRGFGVGYSSQIDIERHVDRVSEMLERDVDIDGWLRDVKTVDGGED